ncbi:chemotaxis-specific protein-glutamate methyltransferase CheB [Chloroflexota bacterium]
MAESLRVLLVDDSPTAHQLLRAIIERAPDMDVVGAAFDGQEAIRMTQELRPDVLLMDVVMPKMTGLEATREIMHLQPTPIVLISATLDSAEADIAFQAINAGALTIQQKPVGPRDPQHDAQANRLLGTLRAMAGVRVIHHWKGRRQTGTLPKPAAPIASTALSKLARASQPRIVGIASSTGGPAALRTIVSRLSPDFPLPIVVVQHIAPDFVYSLVQWLPHVTELKVGIAEEGQLPQPGCLYLAPGGVHLRLSNQHRFVLDEQPNDVTHIPSCDVLFESLATSYGRHAIGVILTGMGGDGARGLLAMYQAGALTIAQDEKTSVVYGMPREAVALGAAQQVLPLPDIPDVLATLVNMESMKHE